MESFLISTLSPRDLYGVRISKGEETMYCVVTYEVEYVACNVRSQSLFFFLINFFVGFLYFLSIIITAFSVLLLSVFSLAKWTGSIERMNERTMHE